MKGTRFIKRYSEKNLIWANGPFYGGGGGAGNGAFWARNGASYNFGSAVRVFCKFCAIKRANR